MRLLAAGIPASRLGIENIAAEAKLQPAEIEAAFPEWEDYLLRLLKTLSEEVRLAAVMAIAKKTPGRSLIREGITAYLDVVLNHPALLEITSACRAHPVCQQITRDRMTSLVTLATLQLKMAQVRNAEALVSWAWRCCLKSRMRNTRRAAHCLIIARR